MGLIKGTCSNCNGQIEFDENLKKGFCLHCGTPFIKEDVVHNYNTTQNIRVENAVIQSGPTEQSLVDRAREYFDKGDYVTSIEYAHKALDINPGNVNAREITESLFSVCDAEITLDQIIEIDKMLKKSGGGHGARQRLQELTNCQAYSKQGERTIDNWRIHGLRYIIENPDQHTRKVQY